MRQRARRENKNICQIFSNSMSTNFFQMNTNNKVRRTHPTFEEFRL